MKKKVATLLSIFSILCILLFSSCSHELNIPFTRKVAREVTSDGWVYTFVHNEFKDKDADDSSLIKYKFFGMNIRYKYDENYITSFIRVPESEKGGKPYTEIITPTFLALGEGSDAEKEDMQIIEKILDSSHSVEYLLNLNPDDYQFKSIDKDMFFRLMKTALTSEPQKEGTDMSYWEKPSYAFFTEEAYIDEYKFQIAFLQETGCVDELYIDVLYRTGDKYNDYVQLSDMIDNNTATQEQKQVFDLITKIVKDIKENENFVYNSDSYKDTTIGEIDFFRLYTFLNNIHENKYSLYQDAPIIEIVTQTDTKGIDGK